MKKEGRLVGDVEKNAIRTGGLHLRINAAGDSVAGGKVAAFIILLHERLPLLVDQNPPFAANRLGDKKILRLPVEEAGRVKLDKLHVGHLGTSPVGHSHTVAGGNIWIGCIQIDLAAAPRTQHRHPGPMRLNIAGQSIQDIGAETAITAPPLAAMDFGLNQQVDGKMVFQHFNVRIDCYLLQESPLDLLTR